MMEHKREKRRRESYECLYGLRFPNASVFDADNEDASLFNSDSGSNKNVLTDLSVFIEQEEPTVAECCAWTRRRFFTKRKLYRLLPPLAWLPNYSLEDLKGDIISGISVAFTIVPQGLALASLAGLPPQYGLYTSFMGCFVYALLGSCKDMAVGPTSILAMIVLPYALAGGPQYSILLAFLGGCLQLLAGILNLGFVVDFISFPVISAFSLAAAITIASSQLKGFFGLHYSASRVIEIWSKFFANISQVNAWDISLGCACLLFLIPLQVFKDRKLDVGAVPEHRRTKRAMYKTLNVLWNLLIIGRNAIAVIIGGWIALTYGQVPSEDDPGSMGNVFTLSRKITPGLPAIQPPQFSVVDADGVVTKSFSEVYSDISTGIFAVALLGLTESVAVANAFKTANSGKLDASQEMIALGVSNILGSFVGAFPATASFSRSAVNHNSGVRTPLGGVVTGGLVLAALSALSTYFGYIPETVLATIIITSVLFMANPADVLIIWRTNPIDLLPYVITFASSLLIGLEVGILIGIGVSIMILLYHMARPHIFAVVKITPANHPFLYVKPDRSIFFSSIDYMKIKIDQNLKELKQYIVTRSEGQRRYIVVVDGEHMFRTDSTFALGLKNMVNTLKERNISVIFYRMRRGVFRVILGVSLHPTLLHNCRNEEEVYKVINSLNESRYLKHSTSLCVAEMQRSHSNSANAAFRNELGTRYHWLSQSADHAGYGE